MFGNAGLEFIIKTVKILEKPVISVRPWKTWEKKL